MNKDSQGLILSCDCNVKGAKMFFFLKNEKKIEKILKLLSKEDHNFYEVLINGKKRKMYWDIDCKDMKLKKEDFDDLIDDLQRSVKKYLKKEDILFGTYTSSTEIKHSYHVILFGYYLTTSEECKFLAKKVLDIMNDKLKKSIKYKSSSKKSGNVRKTNPKVKERDFSKKYKRRYRKK